VALRDLQGIGFAQASRFRTSPPKGASNRKVLSMDRRKRFSEINLEEMLSSLAADNELGKILHDVHEISSTLKSNSREVQSLRVVHPAVWCTIRQALLDRELRYLALADDLTGLYNRRGFFAAATQQLKLACRNAQCLLLFFCDVDNLKKINDSYGHRDGDLALIRAASALEQTFRGSDIVARLAGDEFAVLATEASAQNQKVILRRLEKNLKKSSANESRYEISLSVGLTRFDPKHPVSLTDLMAQADHAMYEQKRCRLGASEQTMKCEVQTGPAL
jgi:diguanylate cyclase (GGDEF)-like protein